MKSLVTTCLLLTISVVARAESLEERKFWKGQRNYVDREMAIAEKQCGTKFTFDWVDPPTLRSETEKSKHTPNGVCLNIINTVATICRGGADEKATVKAKITGFTCGHAKERTLDFKGGVVKYLGNNTQVNFHDWAKPWLMKRL